MSPETFLSIFSIRPPKWGLRGDIGFWSALGAAQHWPVVPASADELERKLYTLFVQLTGEVPGDQWGVYVAEYDKGGMSTGHVSPAFWINKGFPMVIKRFNELTAHGFFTFDPVP